MKLRLKPKVAAAAAHVSTKAQGSGCHLDLSPPSKPKLAAGVSAESQGSGSHSDLWPPSNIKLAATATHVNTEAQGSGSQGDLSCTSGYEYEVFLSFRGPDTRFAFTDFLYHNLLDEGIRAFRDDEELRTGEQIGPNLFRAIEQSKISIPIFSKNYPSSKWCLKELTFMLKRKKEGKHLIFPIFYDVTPSEVQDQTGDYCSALQKHKEKFDAKIVEQWKAALTEVGHLKGMDLVKLSNGYQGKFIKLVVSKVLMELKKAHLIITDNLVGIDDQVEALMQLLQPGTNDVRFLGIWGMGGIGKTTLAGVIYNKLLGDYNGCSFIRDIRETSRLYGLQYIQGSLVADLSRCERPKFTKVDEGIHELRDRCRGKKVLIVLDDINDAAQLNALMISADSFGVGSRIIITTRNKYVLDRDDEVRIYEVKPLKREHALIIFCKHAFRKDTPTDELRDLSCAVVKTTGGLPLALEVIGSFLSRKKKSIWEGTLEKLKVVPNEKVQEKLRISFDALDHEQKQIFLDIACFFIGEDINDVLPMWEACKFFPKVGVDFLVAQSLIKIGDDNEIWMHDQVRDLGREIVRKENYDEPDKRSRLWHGEEAKDVLTKQMGSSNVKAIRVHLYDNLNDEPCFFTSEQFRSLSKLRFLDFDDHVQLDGDFKNLLSSLRWLRWPYSSFGSIINLDLPNLCSLDLQCNDLIDVWKGWGSDKMMSLKVLNLSCSDYLRRTPDFSRFPNLERLVLFGCSHLEVIDPSIGKLKNLIYLDISSCPSIKDLPDQLGSLVKLEILNSNRCTSLTRVPSSIGQLTSLSDLALDHTRITTLSDSIECLRLKRLSLKSCRALIELPGTIGRLSLLEALILEDTSIKSLPVIIGGMFNLQTLNLRDCGSLETIPTLPGCLPDQRVDKQVSLITLDISYCGMLKTLPSLSNLKLLKVLDAECCTKLEELEGLDQLNALERLNISNCYAIEQLPNLSHLKLLKDFFAQNCTALQELVGLNELHALEKLNVSRCTNIETLPCLSKLKILESLYTCHCYKLQELVGLDGLKALKMLKVSNCKEIEKLQDLSKLKQLKELYVDGCENLLELDGLDELEALKKLRISKCKEIKELPNLSKLKHLEDLFTDGCENLQELNGLDELEALKKLRISKCKEIKELPNLSKLKQLEDLFTDGCEKVEELFGLDELSSLKIVVISMCKGIKKLPNISTLKLLKRFDASGCGKLQELVGLDELKALERITISGCKEIRRIPDLSTFKQLIELDVSGCEKLQELEGLGELKTLERLIASGCKEIEKLPNLSMLQRLEELDATGCEKLREIVGIGDLKILRISGCREIEKLPDLLFLKQLIVLDVRGCEKLRQLVGIGDLKALKRLIVSGCKEIEELPDLSRLENLKILDVGGCEKLQELVGLGELKALNQLIVSGCKQIIKLLDLSKLNSLECLDASGCENLRELVGIGEMKALKNLTISGCKEIEKLPDLSKLKRLEVLSAVDCLKLQELAGLEKLKKMQIIDISGCKNLRELLCPENMDLDQLTEIPNYKKIYRRSDEGNQHVDLSDTDDEDFYVDLSDLD